MGRGLCYTGAISANNIAQVCRKVSCNIKEVKEDLILAGLSMNVDRSELMMMNICKNANASVRLLTSTRGDTAARR